MKSITAIKTEIWKVNGAKTFTGRDTLVFVDRFTGEIQEFELVSKTKKEEFIIQDDGTSKLDTEEVYGCNGYKRARWVEEKITNQTEDED
jgi:hypothetical protein